MTFSTTASRRGRETGLQHEADIELARTAAQGDPSARRRLVDQLLDRVRAITTFLASGDDVAEDLAQVALIEILRSIHSFRGESSLATWAERVVVRSTMRELKRSRWRSSLQIVESGHDPPATLVGEDELTRQRMKMKLVELFRALPSKRRLPVVLRLVFGFGIDEIAQMTEARANTVRDQLRTGRAELRGMIHREPLFQDWLKERERANDP